MKIVNTSGQKCPAPLIATKRALKECAAGDSFQVITDSKTSFNNVCRYLTDNKTEYTSIVSDGMWTITVRKLEPGVISSPAENYCMTEIPHFRKGDYIIAFSSDRMGEGDEVLGRKLMLNFVKAVRDLDVLPETMVFYNRGVMLGIEGSETSGHLEVISRMGVKLFFCATCIEHYRPGNITSAGILSNMFEIAQAMASASNVIKP